MRANKNQSLWRRCFQFQGDKKPSQNQRIGSGAPKMPRLSASRHIGCPLLPLNKGVRECVGSSSLSCCSQTERGSNAQIWLAVKHLVLTSGNDTCPTLGLHNWASNPQRSSYFHKLTKITAYLYKLRRNRCMFLHRYLHLNIFVNKSFILHVKKSF